MSYFEEMRPKVKSTESFYPESSFPNLGKSEGEENYLYSDGAGFLATRGPIFTDEGSMRDSFAGTSLSYPLTGTLTFTYGSTEVVGINTNFLASGISMTSTDFIKLDSDTNACWGAVESIEDDTHLTLSEPYKGTSTTGAASYARFIQVIGNGGNISVANSMCTISSGTAGAGTLTYIAKPSDYSPIIVSAYASISQRIGGQLGVIGLMTRGSSQGSTHNSAWFEFSGVDNTKLQCKSSLNSNEEVTNITLPGGYTTDQMLRYRVEVSHEYAQFQVDGVVVATHFNMVPDPYSVLNLMMGWVNTTGPATSSDIVVDTVFVSNANLVQVQSGFTGIPFRVESTPTQKLAQTSASAINAEIVPTMNVLNYRTIAVQLTGTWEGRIEFMASSDGINYKTIGSVNLNTNLFNYYVTTNGIYQIPNSGFSFFKAVVTAYLSGTLYADTTLNNSALPIPSSSPIVAIRDPQNFKGSQITSNRELRVTDSMRLAGAAFWGSTIDTNFWSSTVSNGATNSQSGGELICSSGTTNSALAILKSVNSARYKTGTQNIYRASIRLTEGISGNTRRIGVADASISNGFFFYLEGTVFGVGRRKAGVLTLVPSSSFNGNKGASFIMDTNYHTFEIIYGNINTEFYIDGVLVHSMSSTTTTLVETTNMYITFLNQNTTSTSSTAYIYSALAVVYGLSGHDTQSLSTVIETNGTFTLKIGNGKLKRILNLGNVGRVIVYDNTAGSGTKLLPTMDCARAIGTIDCDVPFNDGLTIVTASGPKLLIVYE